MTSTSDLMTSLIGAAPPTLMALVVYWQGRKTTAQVEKNTVITEKIKGDTEKIGDKAEEIHQSTNGNLTLVRAELAGANGRIEELQKLVSSLIADRTVQPGIEADDKQGGS